MSSVIKFISFSCDYRSVPDIDIIDEKDYTCDEDYCNIYDRIEFALPPADKIRLFSVAGDKILFYLDLDEDDYKNVKNISRKIYSQVHGCMPFKVTGMSCAYKDEGYYPDIPQEILDMPDIDDVKSLSHNYLIAIDSGGDDVYSLIITPLFGF